MNRPEASGLLGRELASARFDRASSATSGADDQSVPLALEYVRIVMRRKLVIAGTLLAFLFLGVLITLLMTPKFTATTIVEIARESNKIVNLQGVEQEASDADQEFYQTQYGLLQSRSLAERVARQLNLVDDPAFFELFDEDPTDEPGQRIVGNRFAPNGREFRTRLAGEILLDNLSVDPTRLSRLVSVSITSPDAELSARLANAWAANFIESTLERRYEATSYARKFLEDRIDQLRRRLEDSERQLVNYASRERIIELPSGTQENGELGQRSIIADELASLNGELARATADRVEAAARYNEYRSRAGESAQALNNSAINTMRARRAELASDYEKMLTQFEPAYPPAMALQSQIQELDRSIGREESRVSSAIGNEYRSALGREQRLTSRIDELKNGVLDVRRRSIQYNIYKREVDSTRILYEGLLQRYKEIGVTGGVGVNNISVVDPAAAPDRRSSPRVALNILLALILGTAAGVALAILLEHIDESISDPSDVRGRIGTALLGTVPDRKGLDPTEELHDRKSELFDAYLAVQSNLALATDHGLPRSLSVTSTRPAEGKSTTSLAIATTLARSGRRVLLIDSDMRSPTLHKLLGRDHDRGLSTYLAGDDNIDSFLVNYEPLGITAMTAGPLPPNAAELLSSDRLTQLLQTLLERFDHVVIDSPPVMGLADAPLIGGRVESTIMVVEASGVRARMVKRAIERLRTGGADVIGTVLTKFAASRSTYGYDYAYGYDYGRDARV